MRIAVTGLAIIMSASVAFAQGGTKPAGATAITTAPTGAPVLVFETDKGTFEIETFPQHAPKTVEHIVGLVQKRFYNGLRVHRIVPNFMVQLGDPQTRDMTKKAAWGTGGSGRTIGVAEFGKGLKHAVGLVAMAHRGDAAQADSQMYIVTGPASHLDGIHQIWGKVSGTGMQVVNKLAVPDRIIRVTVKGAAK